MAKYLFVYHGGGDNPESEEEVAAILAGYGHGSGHVFNLAFDPALVKYAEGYENSLHHSPRFQAYAEELAADLRRELGLDTIAARAAGFALASSEERSYGILIYGVQPAFEPLVSSLPGLVREGRYLDDSQAAEIVIGRVLARNLKVAVGFQGMRQQQVQGCGLDRTSHFHSHMTV